MNSFKRIRYILISLIIVLSVIFTGCSNNSDKKDKGTESSSSKADSSLEIKSENKFCMWEVASKDSKGKLYLFGSIHAADDLIYPLPSFVTDAFDKSDYLAVECDIVAYEKDLKKQIEMSADLTYTDGTTIQDHIDQDTYEKCKVFLKANNSYMSVYDSMKPSVWMSLMDNIVLSKSGLSTGNGLDRHFLNKAKKDKKEILEVESVESQMEMLSGFSDDIMNLLLKSYTTQTLDEQVNSLRELFFAWKAGDIDKIYDLGNGESDSKISEEEAALYEEYNKQMLTNRNNLMVEKAEQYLSENKKCFYVVGAMHMIGNDGIVEQLKAKGYDVKRI